MAIAGPPACVWRNEILCAKWGWCGVPLGTPIRSIGYLPTDRRDESSEGKEATRLILTRRPGESIAIETPAGERIEVTVLGVKGNQLRIGTDAPAESSILREEPVESPPT